MWSSVLVLLLAGEPVGEMPYEDETPVADPAPDADASPAGATPLEEAPAHPSDDAGLTPLEGAHEAVDREADTGAEAPLEDRAETGSAPDMPAGRTPFEAEASLPPQPAEAERDARERVDPDTAMLVRVNLFGFGPQFRTRDIDLVLATGVEYGRMKGLSGAFALELVPTPPQEIRAVKVFEAAMGVGPVLRGRLRRRPLFGSLGLTGGLRIHRARTGDGVLHRVDPDIRAVVQGAWTINRVGINVSVVNGYSFYRRAYEQRGAVVWERSAYRIVLLLGLHLDFVTGSRVRRRSGRTDRKRRSKR